MGFNKNIHNHVFYKDATAITELDTSVMPVVSDESTLNLKFVISEGGKFTAKIYAGIIDKDNFYPYLALKYPSLDMISDTISDANTEIQRLG